MIMGFNNKNDMREKFEVFFLLAYLAVSTAVIAGIALTRAFIDKLIEW